MQLRSHGNNTSFNRQAVALLTVLMATAGATQVVCAQNYDDSLLPPEVVPLDPSTASSLTQAQAAQRQVQMPGSDSGTTGSVPGLVTPNKSNAPMTAQDMRKAAFAQLYNQGQMPQGGMQQGSFMPNQMQNPQMQGGMPGGMGQQMGQGYNPTMMSNNPPPQSQTLSGGAKKNSKIHDIRRGGFSNGLSAGATLGMGALMGGFYRQPVAGLGMYGLMMTGFGARNGFRL